MTLLDDARNVFGALAPDVRARIVRFLDAPSAATWDGCYSVVVNERGTLDGRVPLTVWQAVVALDPSFQDIANPEPRGARLRPEEKWRRIPDALLTARAIRAATAPQFHNHKEVK